MPDAAGLYAQDLQIIRFWNSLPALAGLPPWVRYHAGRPLGPREHWALGLAGDAPAGQAMLADGCLALGPAGIGDLSPIIAAGRFRDTRLAVETAFRDAGREADAPAVRDLAALTAGLTEGSLVMLFLDAASVAAVGEVSGGYRYVPGHDRPHQVAVNWLHQTPFDTVAPAKPGPRLLRLKPDDPAVAHGEASLLVNGVGPWPGFRASVTGAAPPPPVAIPTTADPAAQPLPPPQGLHRQLLDVLERKRQVILYGPPGTGKTWHAGQVALELVARHNFARVPSQLSEPQRDLVQGRGGTEPYIATCTFHPGYAYEDFIEGYRPDGAGFRLEPGLFKRMARAAAAQPDKRFVLIIDEINRGNIPRIFGELITLIQQGARPGEAGAPGVLPLASFTLNMNLLFERFLGRYLREQAPADLRVHPQESRADVFWFLNNGGGWQAPRIRPDFVFRRRGAVLAVADAKYRDRHEHPPTAAELYQLCAYGLAYGLVEPAEVLLLHPLVRGAPERPTTLLFAPSALGKAVRIRLVGVPVDGLLDGSAQGWWPLGNRSFP